MTPSMLIQLKKGRDSGPTLTCVRADGTRTWRRMHPFFPLHDLTHYAVERVLGFTDAFFGLVASGWSLDTFEQRGAPARLPPAAIWAESIVGLLDLERGMNRIMSAAEFSDALRASLRRQGASEFRALTEAELAGVRSLRGELHARWRTLEPGETLEVPWEP